MKEKTIDQPMFRTVSSIDPPSEMYDLKELDFRRCSLQPKQSPGIALSLSLTPLTVFQWSPLQERRAVVY
jgi:hypothetical protein